MPLFELLPERIEQPLLPGGLIEPEGVTILYGSPGSKKGVVAAWQAMELVHAGYRVAILDFEGRERQWRLRMRDIPKNTLYYFDAQDPIDVEQDQIESEVLVGFEPHVLIIDSGSMAIPEIRGATEPTCVRKLYRILKDWQRPAFILHHVSKADMRGSDALPLGTVQWYAQARLAINIDKTDGGVIALHFKKANDRVEPKSIYCQWDWDRRRMQLVQEATTPKVTDVVIAVLKSAKTPVTTRWVHEQVNAQPGMDRTIQSIVFTLNQLVKSGLVEKPDKNRYILRTQ